jgi:Histidine kinase
MKRTINSLGNIIHRTPWWAVGLGGLFIFLLLAVFTVPFNVIRLSDAGATPAENRAIQREIDRSFGNSAINVAERVVRTMSERATDPARREELEQALRDLEEARADLMTRQNEIDESAKVVRQETEQNQRAERELRAAALADRNAAKSRLAELRAARKAAKKAQQQAGTEDAAILADFDRDIREAEAAYDAANQYARDVRNSKVVPTTPDSDAASKPKLSPAPDKTKTTTISISTADGLKFESTKREQSIKGDITLAEPDSAALALNDQNAALPPVSPAMRDEIRRHVASDVKRLGIGSALIVAFIPLFIMLLIAKFYIGRSRRAQEVAKVKTAEAESANVNRQIVEAKLMALQAQVEPHFLYNTLANVQALTEVDPAQANQMTGHLIQYLRAALPKMRENTSTVGQELDLVRAYLNILKMRMGARLEFGINVPDALLSLPFPPLMLPSLVENAIKHGLEPQREGGRIDVSAEKVGEGSEAMIRLVVVDTGRGLTNAPVQAGGGVGLTNIRERLLALFGSRGKLILESNQPKGVRAVIEVPAAGSSLFGLGSAGADNNFVATTAATNIAQPLMQPAPNWRARTLRAAARTHNVWLELLVKLFVGVVAVLGVMFVVGMIGIAAGLIPLNIGSAKLGGMEGIAIGTIVLALAFGLISIAVLVVLAIIYGLSFILVGIAIGIPVLIVLSLFPALIPLAIVGFVLYWFWWRKRRKQPEYTK